MITRAVDDQAAKELLGTGFKRQIQLDGNYSNVTFICTKTDDINLTEAADSFDLDDEINKLNKAKHKLSEWTASSELDKLKERKEAVSVYADEVDKHMARYEKLRTPQANGKIVTPPQAYPKRKGGAHARRQNKRRKVEPDENSQDTHWASTEDHWESLEKGIPKFSAEQHLTQEDIQLMVEYLRSQKDTATEEKERLQQKIDQDESYFEDLQEDVCALEEELTVACVSRRNECSRGVIGDQFAIGLME
jgi:hypothetical protein